MLPHSWRGVCLQRDSRQTGRRTSSPRVLGPTCDHGHHHHVFGTEVTTHPSSWGTEPTWPGGTLSGGTGFTMCLGPQVPCLGNWGFDQVAPWCLRAWSPWGSPSQHVCVRACACMCMFARVHTCVCTYMCMCVHACVHVRVRACVGGRVTCSRLCPALCPPRPLHTLLTCPRLWSCHGALCQARLDTSHPATSDSGTVPTPPHRGRRWHGDGGDLPPPLSECGVTGGQSGGPGVAWRTSG